MLRLRQTKHLLAKLGATPSDVEEIISRPDEFYEELLLLDPQKPEKKRRVINDGAIAMATIANHAPLA